MLNVLQIRNQMLVEQTRRINFCSFRHGGQTRLELRATASALQPQATSFKPQA